MPISTSCTMDNRPTMVSEYAAVGTVSGGNLNYCAIEGSAYRSRAFENIWSFSITYPDGTNAPAYCLEKGVRGPQGEPYQSSSFETCLPNSTPDQRARTAWLITNAYPALSAAQMFACAGVDPNQSPQLNESDAYAAVQIAIWSVFNPPQDRDAGWEFYDCQTGGTHPKSDRLRQTVAYLFDASMDSLVPASAEDGGAPLPLPAHCRCAATGSAMIIDCGPGAMHFACGKVLYGPLMVCSGAPFELTLCEMGPHPTFSGFITVTDGCGKPIAAPGSGEEFYLAFPPAMPPTKYQLSAMVRRTMCDFAVLCPVDPSIRLQAIGVAIGNCRDELECTCLGICFDPPKPTRCEVLCCAPREKMPKPSKCGSRCKKGYR